MPSHGPLWLGGRSQANALLVIAAEGVSLSDEEKTLFNESLGLTPRELAEGAATTRTTRTASVPFVA